MNLHEFVQNYCEGKQYDSCVESPCRFSSHSGCRHPMHPNNSGEQNIMSVSDLLFDYQKEWIENPDFSYSGRVHNWRRYIPQAVKDMWHTLSVDTRAAFILMADGQADDEEWD